uniref:AAA+ ATPase domain-containing protein n=1 Tax=Electrophorus electricus TaxID=8005 RepID=A0A4W4GFA8_ELEEL
RSGSVRNRNVPNSVWVEPSFGDLFGSSGLNSLPLAKAPLSGGNKSRAQPSGVDVGGKKPRKRKGALQAAKPVFPPRRQDSQEPQDEPWVQVYAPQLQAELAVHKKKVEEVEKWLRVHLDLNHANKGGAVLLLTGPSGCGKTATVHVLARDLGCQIQEWSNPVTTSEYRTDDSFRQTFDPGTGAFQEFLLRANKYDRLPMRGDGQAQDRKLILVEDFPNQFYRQPGCLHDTLRRFARTGRRPLVFVVSDSLSGDSSSRLLFPKEVQEELGIRTISFNPIAPTSMMKVLSRIAAIEANKVNKAVLEQLCAGSSGDIRSAINSLQFSSFAEHSLEKGAWASKKGKSAASAARVPARPKGGNRSTRSAEVLDDSPAIGGKDTSLFLFRALGKILYCKRHPCSSSEQLFLGLPKLPSHLSVHQRDRMIVDPELVVERSHMSGEFFSLYLHQNYPDFFSDMDDVARASEYLSDADFLTAEWSSRPTMSEYGSSVATRGLIYSNSARAQATSQSHVGFKPLHKPHWLHINKTYRENYLAAQSLFISFCLTPVSLMTELVPYLAQLSNPMRNQAQIAFIQDVGHLSLRRFPGRLKLEALGDKEPGGLDLDGESDDAGTQTTGQGTRTLPSSSQEPGADFPSSQPQPTTADALLDEEDILIEEYDSD